MKVIALKVWHKENLDELEEVIRRGRTLEDELGGWQMPKDALPGDLAIWYTASPDQEYRAYGWVSGIPCKPGNERVKYYGPSQACTHSPHPCRGRRLPQRLGSTKRAWASSQKQSMSG